MSNKAQTNAVIENAIVSTLIRSIINAGMLVAVRNNQTTKQVRLNDYNEIMTALPRTGLQDLIIHNGEGEVGYFMLYFGESNGCDVIAGRSSNESTYALEKDASKLSYQLNVNYEALCAMRAANLKSITETDPACVIELIQNDHNCKVSSLFDSTNTLSVGDVIDYGRGVTSVVLEVMKKAA